MHFSIKSIWGSSFNTKSVISILIVIIATSLISIVTGLVAVTGNYKVSVFYAAIFIIILLLLAPYLLFLLTSMMVLVISGLTIYFIPSMSNVLWIGYLLALSLYIPIFISFFSKNHTLSSYRSSCNQVRVWSGSVLFWLVIFFIVAIFSTLLATPAIPQIISALKSIFFMGSLWLFFSYMDLTRQQVLTWFKFLLAIATLQFVIALYQFVFVRGDRISNSIGSIEAADSVVGTFGGSMESGGLTAVLAVFIISVLVMISAFRYYSVISRKKYLFLSLLIAPTLLLIEVKALFVFLPIVALTFMKDEIKAKPLVSFFRIVLGSTFLLLLLFIYQTLHWSLSGAGLSESIVNVFTYSFSSEGGYYAESLGQLTRMGTYLFWFNEHGTYNLLEAILGHGLGASKTQGLLVGEVARQYAPYNIDRIGVVSLLWDVGVLGVISIFGVLITAMLKAGKITQMDNVDVYLKAIAKGLFSIFPIFMLSLLYRNDIPYAAPMMFLLMTSLGLLLWVELQIKKSFYEKQV